ncbi:hypothetical protein ABIB66_006148 [Bradyrhizobium sp. F1.13.3]
MVPMTLNDLAIGSANGGANDFLHGVNIYYAKGRAGAKAMRPVLTVCAPQCLSPCRVDWIPFLPLPSGETAG